MTTRKALVLPKETSGNAVTQLDAVALVVELVERYGAKVIELTRETVSWRHDHPQSPVYPKERTRWVSEWEEGEKPLSKSEAKRLGRYDYDTGEIREEGDDE